MRVALLTLRSLSRSWVRAAILALLVGVSLLVLLVVSELSRTSQVGLEDAIAADVGTTGSYAVFITPGRGLSDQELIEGVAAAMEGLARAPLTVTRTYPMVGSDCPPLEALGEVDVAVVTTADGAPVALPYGHGLPDDTELCLDGLTVPREAVYLPDGPAQRTWGSALFLDPRYGELADRAISAPPTLTLRLVTGGTDDQTAVLERAQAGLARYSEVAGLPVTQLVAAVRTDDGEALAQASRGITLVYQVIGYAVVALAGLALLVAQTIRTQHRLWFYGLARSMGAKRRHIVILVGLDALVILIAGLVLALVAAGLAGSTVRSFARDAFAVDAQLLSWSVAPTMSLGLALILALSTIYPVLIALRQDPIDILEARRG